VEKEVQAQLIYFAQEVMLKEVLMVEMEEEEGILF
jgi:hypothetical protein